MKIEEKVLSERMRDFLCEMDLDMADEDMVEIIKRSPMLSWKERVRALEELAGKTKDLYLSDRIHSGLAMEKIAYNDFRSPKDDYLFALIGNEPHVAPRYVCCFKTIELAETGGKKLGISFSIYKVPVMLEGKMDDWRRWKAVFYEEGGVVADISYIWPGKAAVDPRFSYDVGEGEHFAHSSKNSSQSIVINIMHPCKEGDIVRDMASGCNGVVTRDTQIGLVFVTFFEDGKWQKEVAFEPWLLDYPEYSCTAEKELLVAASNQIRKSWNSLRMLQDAMRKMETEE